MSQLLCALETCSPDLCVEVTSACEILNGALSCGVQLLCFPGGFDLGYLETLGKRGCDMIRQWVTHGGSYLGICAGAYFAAERLEFDRGGPLEVCGERFLKFYPGVARGPAFPGFDYNSELGSRAARVQLTAGLGNSLALYVNGAPTFSEHPPGCPNVEEVMWLEDGRSIGVRCGVGRGAALLLGAHVEYDPKTDPEADKIVLQARNEALKEDEARRLALVRHLVSDLLRR